MKRPNRLQVVIFLLGVAGATLLVVLLLRHGMADIAAALAVAGAAGVAVVVISHLAVVLLDALAGAAWLLDCGCRDRRVLRRSALWHLSAHRPASRTLGAVRDVGCAGRAR